MGRKQKWQRGTAVKLVIFLVAVFGLAKIALAASPTVFISNLYDGQHVSGQVEVQAMATDDGAIDHVEFYYSIGSSSAPYNLIGTGTFIGNSGTSAFSIYSIDWDTSSFSPANYWVKAVAYDNENNYTSSQPVMVEVPDTIAPTTSITSPQDGSYVSRRSVVTIAADANDNIGVNRVEFYVDSVLTCTDYAYPYSCNWTVPNIRKTFHLQTKAFDNAGNFGTSAIVSVTSR